MAQCKVNETKGLLYDLLTEEGRELDSHFKIRRKEEAGKFIYIKRKELK